MYKYLYVYKDPSISSLEAKSVVDEVQTLESICVWIPISSRKIILPRTNVCCVWV